MNAHTGSGGPHSPGPPRRRPVQQRSQERYERLLDACAGLLDEVGPTALTTKEVAQRAGVPIGTLYQFFSGKENLLGALAERNLARYLDRLGELLAAAAPVGVPEFVDLAVDEFVAMKRSRPGFGQLDFGLVGTVPDELREALLRENPLLVDDNPDANAAVAQRIGALGGGLFSGPGSGPVVRVALECADAVLKLAFRVDPDGDAELIAECRRLLRCYLSAAPEN